MTETASTAKGDFEIRDCRLTLGRSGAKPLDFSLPSLDVAAGERVALTGPSGCGKSTLLNLIAGLVRPDEGTIRVGGTDLTRMSVSALDTFRGRTIGFIYQSFNLLDAFNVLENVLIGMRFGRAIEPAGRRRRAHELLERVGLGDRLHIQPNRLSMGERQRVAVARAVANRPSLILADEPTGSLDPETAETVFDLILAICGEEDRTLLFVAHDRELARKLPRQFDCRKLVRRSTVEAAL
jgi:ABC-type lipoprotein export system ATPase subunit